MPILSYILKEMQQLEMGKNWVAKFDRWKPVINQITAH